MGVVLGELNHVAPSNDTQQNLAIEANARQYAHHIVEKKFQDETDKVLGAIQLSNASIKSYQRVIEDMDQFCNHRRSK